ncbi:MAG: transglutaminase-like domain-containing protein [Burkholderiales bacterium]|jgi:hypothetical protein|nr:transglutaminase-like domain-containing protein [Burkholderiales bacterium]
MKRCLDPIATALLALAGCAGVPPSAPPPWRDAEFAYDPARVAVGKEELFRLPPDLATQLRGIRATTPSPDERQQRLTRLLFSAGGEGFFYRTGQPTLAAQTRQEKRGDCLSLTVLAYAMARELGLPATMQDVRVSMQIDRRGEIDYLNRHVNVLIPQAAAAPASRS